MHAWQMRRELPAGTRCAALAPTWLSQQDTATMSGIGVLHIQTDLLTVGMHPYVMVCVDLPSRMLQRLS